jgi:hypothetical protein
LGGFLDLYIFDGMGIGKRREEKRREMGCNLRDIN